MATPELADHAEIWPVESSTDLFRGDWVVALRSDTIRRPDEPDGEPFDRVVLEHPGAVVILALDEESRVLCLRQYRHPARRRFVELPAGLLDEPGERPEDVAQAGAARGGRPRGGALDLPDVDVLLSGHLRGAPALLPRPRAAARRPW